MGEGKPVLVVRRGPKPRFGPEQSMEFVRRYMSGESARKIGRDFGVSYQTILTYMRQVAVEPQGEADVQV